MQGEPREVIKYTDKMAAEPLRKFAFAEALPLVVPFTAATTELIFGSDIARHLLLVGAAADVAPGSALHDDFKAASAALRDKQAFIFVAVDADGEEGEPVLEYFKLSKGKLPAVVGFQIEPDQRRYRRASNTHSPGACCDVCTCALVRGGSCNAAGAQVAVQPRLGKQLGTQQPLRLLLLSRMLMPPQCATCP